MKRAIRISVALVVGSTCGSNIVFAAMSNPPVFENYRASSISSVKAYKTGRVLNNPIIELKSNETITVEFDDLSEGGASYDYTFVHCTFDWQKSDLIFMDYCNGFEYNRIGTYYNSIGTTLSYIHHSLSFPNSDISFKISGNYILQVVDSYDHTKVLLQQRFFVVEPILSMNTSIHQPLVQDLLFTSQQLELEVNIAPLGNIDPDNDIITVVCQNSQTDNQPLGVKSSYITPSQIRYTAPDALIFDGCNEYRSLNLKSFSYQTPQIRKIENSGGEMHVQLSPDMSNKDQDYTENPDINGRFIIKRDDSNDSNIEADYAWVYFTLTSDKVDDADVYLYGEFTGWNIIPSYKLNYNDELGVYELKVLLKQGYYNYRYITVDRETGAISHSRLEGNHFSAENSYQITVYYKYPGIRFWRLVGIKTISSRFSVN